MWFKSRVQRASLTMFYAILLFLICFPAACILWLSLIYVARYNLRHFQGPLPGLFFGNALLIKEANGLLHEAYTKVSSTYGKMYLFFLGPDPVIIVSGNARAFYRISYTQPPHLQHYLCIDDIVMHKMLSLETSRRNE